jgi:hypothetical protein
MADLVNLNEMQDRRKGGHFHKEQAEGSVESQVLGNSQFFLKPFSLRIVLGGKCCG